MLYGIKKTLSKYINKRISLGYGTTVSDVRITEEDAGKVISKPISSLSKKYSLAVNLGLFELDGLYRTKLGMANYKVRHVATGTVISIPKNIFTLLFQLE